MTQRELLFKALSQEETDRTPVWMLFPYHRLNCYADIRSEPSYKSVFEASKKYAVTLDRRSLSVRFFTEEKLKAEPGVKPLIRSDKDLEIFCSQPINSGKKNIDRELEKQLPQYLKEKKEFPKESGAMMLDLGEPICSLYSSADLLLYPLWSVTHNDLIKDFLDRMMTRCMRIYKYCLERDLADVYFLVGSELASPPMVSPGTFRQWIVPYSKKLIELVHSYGKKAIQHYHGQIKEILPDFLEMGADALHTIEAPPVGNCTMAEAFEITENKMTLIGNIQYDCFRSYSPDQMKEAVISLLKECDGKNFILSPSAGPYEQKITKKMSDNYIAFMETGFYSGRKN